MIQAAVSRNTETDIWSRLLQPTGKKLTVSAARTLLRLDFTQLDKERMRELAAKAREGTLSRSETEETRNYERVGTLLAIMKSKARKRLQSGANSNGSAD